MTIVLDHSTLHLHQVAAARPPPTRQQLAAQGLLKDEGMVRPLHAHAHVYDMHVCVHGAPSEMYTHAS